MTAPDRGSDAQGEDSRRRGVSLPLAAAVAVLVLLLGLANAVYFGSGPAAREGHVTHVTIESGAKLPQIARRLKEAGVIDSPMAFMTAATLTGSAKSLKAGQYAFPSRSSLARVLEALRAGAVMRFSITIPEGFTSAAAVRLLNHTDGLTGEAAAPPEGALLPETYDLRRDERRDKVLARMVEARNRLVDRLWTHRAANLPYRSADEGVILASIVERETAKASERPHIAAVFINRLRKGMRLESDPTVIYGLTQGEPLGHGLRVSELRRPTPYNTYLVSGLPPTPIANPGRAALKAAFDPQNTDDLFFVADGRGGHVFSDSYEVHLQNVARWRTHEQSEANGVGR